jgi:5'-phosphate synthase pdxT subunit
VLATCAGLILLAREVSNPAQHSLGLLDVSVERNGYGRQTHSFITRLEMPVLGPEPLEAVFIRAPVIRRVGAGVDVLATHDGLPVMVRQGSLLAASFHPELTEDTRVHRLLLETV